MRDFGFRYLFVLSAGLPYCCGCESKQPVQTTITIPCRVVIVLKAGESAGNPANVGCRLTEQEVREYMDELNRNGGYYGLKVVFDYNNTVQIWGSLNIISRPTRLVDWLGLIMNPQFPNNEPNYDPNKINIYFTGMLYFDDPNNNRINANTFDPFDANHIPGLPPVRPHILVTDRSYPNSGGNPQQGGALVRLSDRVLEHEMGHFLLRTRLGINPNPRYDDAEHDVPTATHQMKRATPHGPISPADMDEC